MKTINYLCTLISSMLILASCSKEDEQPEASILQGKVSGQIFYASVESNKQPITKVYADENIRVLWNKGDCISVFNKSTYNNQYLFTGEDGDNYGRFEEVPETGLISGNSLSNIYAVYPYSPSNQVNNDGTAVTMNLPSEQAYKEHSFGEGANAMIAVADNNFLAFKNIGGYLSLKLYGDNISVSSITICGNNNEKISGKASIDVSTSTVPVTAMDNSATDVITLVCDPPVLIGATAENSTDFWFVIPPITFSKGFTITVTDILGGTFEKSTTRSFTVTRNQLDWMNALKIEPNYDNATVQFEDDNFKQHCLQYFDEDQDNEISVSEASKVFGLQVVTNNIYSLKGIEYFVNLRILKCYGSSYSSGSGTGKLQKLDVSNNRLLQTLDCDFNQLTELNLESNGLLKDVRCAGNKIKSLDISKNTELNRLDCHSNQLTSLDLSKNVKLTELECSDNQLTSLSLSQNTELTSLSCDKNQLTSLDLRPNTALTRLSCYNNQLTSLDLSQNTALTYLSCYNNQLTSLSLSQNTALTSLSCDKNQLTSLDLSQNTALTYLSCSGNKLTSLNLSQNQALTKLWCDKNQLTSLDLGQTTALTYLSCYNNQLTSLDLDQTTALTYLSCYNNQLTSLDLGQNTALTYLSCYNNQLISLDLGQNTTLTQLGCYNNQLTTLDISAITEILTLSAWPQSNVNLEYLYQKKGQSVTYKSSSGRTILPLNYGTQIVLVE